MMNRLKNRKTEGFTLIELLIVIAIIGILAAVLIPNLLGARVSANKRAVQAHSSNVYKALTAALADDPTASVDSIKTAYGAGDCKAALATSATIKYGWSVAPGAVDTCVITTTGNDFVVTVTGNGSADSKVSVNGGAPS